MEKIEYFKCIFCGVVFKYEREECPHCEAEKKYLVSATKEEFDECIRKVLERLDEREQE